MNFSGHINKKSGNSKDFKSLVWIIATPFTVCDPMTAKLDMRTILGDDSSMILIDDMRAAGFGRIISISSINGQKGQFGQTNYAASKAGDLGFTKSLAMETASKGITVNAVAPGYIGTEMVRAVPEEVLNTKIIPQIPVGRLGEAEEIARCVSFLAADDAGFITGSTLTANGGQYLI